MPIGGHNRQFFAINLQKQTIEIVTNILHRHRKSNLMQAFFQFILRQGDRSAIAASFLN